MYMKIYNLTCYYSLQLIGTQKLVKQMILHLQCNRTVVLDGFFKQILQDPVKISWIGSGCSVATEPTAEISHYYNITQVIQQ